MVHTHLFGLVHAEQRAPPLDVVLSRIQWSHAWTGKCGPISSHSSRRIIHPKPGKYDVRYCAHTGRAQASHSYHHGTKESTCSFLANKGVML